MTFPKFTRVLAALALVVPAVSSAAIINVNKTVDLTTLDLNSSFIQALYTQQPVSLAIGDTVNLSYDFAGNQTLKMFNPAQIYGWLGSNDGGCTSFQASGTLNFVNGSGPLRSANGTQSGSCAHFGLVFQANAFTSAAGPIEFSGMNFSMTVDSYDNRTSRTYGGPWLLMQAGRFEIGTEAAAVPEPATFGLLGLGIAALAAVRRRKLSVK